MFIISPEEALEMLHLWAYPCQGSELRSKSLPSGHVMSLPSALHLGEKPSEQMQSERHTFMYLTISLIEMAVPSWHTRSDWGLLVYGHHGIPPLEHPTPVCFFTDPSPTHLHWNKVIKDLFYNAILVLDFTLFGLHLENKVVGSKGNLTTVLSWQRHRLISPLGHRANSLAKSGGIVFLSTVGVSLQ